MTGDLLTLDQAAALIPGADAGTLLRRARSDISALVPEQDWLWDFFKGQIRASRQRSVKRKSAHQISVEFLVDLTARQQFKCAVSGIAFTPPYPGRREPFQPSVDRIDNRRGYEFDNVRLVCLIVNLARSDFGDEALFKMADAIAALPK